MSNLKAREALHKWLGVEDRRMHENLLLFSTYSLVLGKIISWSGLSFLHAPLQASPTRCPLTSCPPVRRRPRPPLPKMNTTRMGIWTSLGLAQVSQSWWSGGVLMLGGEWGELGVQHGILKSHLWGSMDVRFSLPPSRQESDGSEHIELSQGVNVKPGNPPSSSVPVPAFGKQVALQSRVGPEQGQSHQVAPL